MADTQPAQIVKPIEWLGDKVKLLDQTRLPDKVIYIETADYREIVTAIKELKVRGAPAIGVAAAYGIALGALSLKTTDKIQFARAFRQILQDIKESRPTAVNLFKSVDRMSQVFQMEKEIYEIKDELVTLAIQIHYEEKRATEAISRLGAELIQDGFTILTHCNTGPLATTGYGTALGIILAAQAQGKNIKAIATETRPLLQGARLTTWELKQAGIPVTLIVDSAAGYIMKTGKVNCVITGADRIAANGDTANKIGTYTLAVLARENNLPFYVAAPTSTIDVSISSGKQIIIEERSPDEITKIGDKRLAPIDIKVYNPAFDITPYKYLSAIITENGIVHKPYHGKLKKLLKENK